MRALALALMVALAVSGCAKLKEIFSTPPAPPPPSVEPAPPPPPAVLSPQVGSEQERRLQRDAQDRIDRTERLLGQLDPNRMGAPQQERYQTIQSFLGKAKEALYARDVQRAMTLADKALLLADELTKSPR
jgi:hypothetical protein